MRRGRSGFLRAALAAACVLLAGGVVPRGGLAQQILEAPAAAPPPNPFVAAVRSLGVRRCLPALAELSAIGERNTVHSDGMIDWDRGSPDTGPVFALLGMQTPQANAAMLLSAVPQTGGACSIAAERIAFEHDDCAHVAARELGGLHGTPLVPHLSVYTSAQDRGSSVTLIDAAPGCVVIRRYVKIATASAGKEAP